MDIIEILQFIRQIIGWIAVIFLVWLLLVFWLYVKAMDSQNVGLSPKDEDDE